MDTNNQTIGTDGKIQNIDTSTLSNTQAPVNLDKETVLTQLQDQAGAISSQGSIDEMVAGYQSAIQEQRNAAASNEAKIKSQYGRESEYLSESLASQRSGMISQTRGGAIGFQALSMVDKQIEKSMRDLEQRKFELISEGNTKAAEKISDLLVRQNEMKVNLQQQAFTNMLGLGQYQETVLQRLGQERQQARQMTMDQLNYNLQVQDQVDRREYNASQLANDAVRINIMRSELDLKQQQFDSEAWLRQPIRGFPNVAVRGAIINEITPELKAIAANNKLTEEQKYAELGLIYSNLRLKYGGVADETELRKLVYGPESGKGFSSDLYGPEQAQLDDWISSSSETAKQASQLRYTSPLQKAAAGVVNREVNTLKAIGSAGTNIYEFMFGLPGKTY